MATKMINRAGWCAWCGDKLPADAGRGRPRVYCSDSCRSLAHRWRTRLRACGLLSDACRRRHGVLHAWEQR